MTTLDIPKGSHKDGKPEVEENPFNDVIQRDNKAKWLGIYIN